MSGTFSWVYADAGQTGDPSFDITFSTSRVASSSNGSVYYPVLSCMGTFNGQTIVNLNTEPPPYNLIYTTTHDTSGLPTFDGLSQFTISFLLPDMTDIGIGSVGNSVAYYTSYQNTTIAHPALNSVVYTPAMTACFAQCTRIETARGLVAVELLTAGDLVASAFGGNARVVWTGHRRVACDRHPRPWDVMPVRVRAGAFGPDLPMRDLVLSPDHAIAWNGVLIPIRYLINDATIVQEQVRRITYWHVECAQHDVLLAEGLPAESYLDTGNRGAFDHATLGTLHPDFAVGDRQVWADLACLPLVVAGPLVDAARAALAVQARRMYWPVAAFHPMPLDRIGTITSILPAGGDRVHLLSFCQIPPGEHRRLGVALSAIDMAGESIGLASAALASGFHGIESQGAQSWRWTHGEAVLMIAPAAHPRRLSVEVSMRQAVARAA